jgi:hypothetical protein
LSLEKIGIKEVKTYSIGKKSFNAIQDFGFKATLIDDELNTGFQYFRQGNWAAITFKKFEIIYENLLENDFVCFTDGDIVFKKEGVLDYCKEAIGDCDLLIQNDCEDDSDDSELCSGFMFIKSNEATIDFFNPITVKENSSMEIGWGDQVYVNKFKERIAYKKLPLSLFPNGQYFYKNHSELDPYIIHFNWVGGYSKAWYILKYKEFYSTKLALQMMPQIFMWIKRGILARL